MKRSKQVRLPAIMSNTTLKAMREVFKQELTLHAEGTPIKERIELTIKEIDYRLKGGDRHFKIKPASDGTGSAFPTSEKEAERPPARKPPPPAARKPEKEGPKNRQPAKPKKKAGILKKVFKKAAKKKGKK